MYREKYIETNYETNEDVYTSCPHCTDSRQLNIEKAILSRHLAIIQKIKNESPKIINIGIPAKYQNKTIHDFDIEWLTGLQKSNAELAILKVSDYIETEYQNKRNLIMCGNYGTGKTMLACIIANMIENCLAHFTTTSQLYMDIIQSYENNNHSIVLNSYVHCDLLVIDEVGNRKRELKPHESDMLFHIMNKRYELMKPAIIISNSIYKNMAKVIQKEFGERILDRIFEKHMVIDFNWGSYRRKGRQW
jgi:DNA replication protein DnaC